MKNLILSLVMIFTVAQTAKADILVEPLVGYTLSGEAGTSDATGSGYGARLGWQSLGLMIGLDYQSNNLTVETSPDIDFTSTETGVFIGYNLPVMLRFWAAYMIGGEFKQDNGSSAYKGISGYKFGVGFTGLPFVSINIEMKSYEYDEDETGAAITPASEYKATMLSVSLPLTF